MNDKQALAYWYVQQRNRKRRRAAGGNGLGPPEKSVLFFGNSFTYGEDGITNPPQVSVPDIFKALANAAGHNPVVKSLTAPGQRWGWHIANPATPILLKERPWTHIVLQNNSISPTHCDYLPEFYYHGHQFYDLIAQDCPNAGEILFYETWAYGAANTRMTGTHTSTTFIDPEEMSTEVVTNYAALADELNTDHPGGIPSSVLGVGRIKRALGAYLPQAHPDFLDLYAPNHVADNWIHGNRPWYFTAGCAFFAQIYGKNPTDYADSPEVLALAIDWTGYDRTALATVAYNFVKDGTYPVIILTAPADDAITEGGSSTFVITAQGNPLEYQWRVDGADIPGANSASYEYVSEIGGTGTFIIDCRVSNQYGSKLSGQATLYVTEAAPEGPYATGGTIVEAGGWRTHTFLSSADIVFERGGNGIEYLIVGGGGGGGGAGAGNGEAGAGGGGGVLAGTISMIAGTFPVVVGAGGAGGGQPINGAKGGDSSFGGLTAIGGGYGAERFSIGGTGGCGGGSGGNVGTSGSGTPGQGYDGGHNGGASTGAGGGGGAGEAGGNGQTAVGSAEGANGAKGGDGYLSSISGTAVKYGAGGGGGTNTQGTGGRSSFGGNDGGGKGQNNNGPTSAAPGNGTNGLGAGGGGAGSFSGKNGGNGGSGVVIIRYPIS